MGYIEKNLIDDEAVIYEAETAWTALILPIIAMIFLIWASSKIDTLLVVVTIFSFIYLIIRAKIRIMTTEFALTNRRIIAKKGFINRNTMEIHLKQLESISVSQPLDGRIFRFGTVTVVGTGGTREEFKSISNPFELQKQVNNQTSTSSK